MKLSIEILRVLYRRPRLTPVLIHQDLPGKTTYEVVERVLRTLHELGLVEKLSRGVYFATPLGVDIMQSSEKTQEVSDV